MPFLARRPFLSAVVAFAIAMIEMLIAALLTARIAFVAASFDAYRLDHWSMLDIRDGGFTPWAGATAAVLVVAERCWRRPALRKPLAVGLTTVALTLGALFGAISIMESASLPSASLTNLQGEATDLPSLAAGQPVVLNLWATWCTPCRYEMPVLAAAQKQLTGIRFVFANQGEDGTTVQRYLTATQLELTNVLLDPGAKIGREIGSLALPITLFYDGRGRLVDSNLGALSAAALASKLDRMRSRALSQEPTK